MPTRRPFALLMLPHWLVSKDLSPPLARSIAPPVAVYGLVRFVPSLPAYDVKLDGDRLTPARLEGWALWAVWLPPKSSLN